jgi:predicted negative regulator of RcsB-dependent stress response
LAQHISRKELKKDEVRDTLAHGAEAVLSHQRSTLYIVAVAVIVALGIYGWRTYSERQDVQSSAEFYNAINVFNAAVGAPTTPGQLAHGDANKKFAEAQQKFGTVASRYPRTRSGQLARYYEALSLEKLNRTLEAKQALQGIVGIRDQEVAGLAKFELAKLDDLTGNGDEAAKYYQELINKPTILVPKAIVMLTLAEHYSQKDPAQAAKVYAQIKSEYPDTPIAEQADQEMALLPGKG